MWVDSVVSKALTFVVFLLAERTRPGQVGPDRGRCREGSGVLQAGG